MITVTGRPRTLSDVVDQSFAVKVLRGWMRTARASGVPASVLITGPSGTGKTTLAHAMAGELRGTLYPVASAECTVEKVRHLRDDILPLCGFLGAESPWKVVLVDEAHTISRQAMNAWLTVLENLPRWNLVVFTTTENDAFDVMWRSRCIYVDTAPLSHAGLVQVLTRHYPGAAHAARVETVASLCAKSGSARLALQQMETSVLYAEACDETRP